MHGRSITDTTGLEEKHEQAVVITSARAKAMPRGATRHVVGRHTVQPNQSGPASLPRTTRQEPCSVTYRWTGCLARNPQRSWSCRAFPFAYEYSHAVAKNLRPDLCSSGGGPRCPRLGTGPGRLPRTSGQHEQHFRGGVTLGEALEGHPVAPRGVHVGHRDTWRDRRGNDGLGVILQLFPRGGGGSEIPI